MSPIILAYSGGLDTSFCVPWLTETYGRPVVTATVDTGGIDSGKFGNWLVSALDWTLRHPIAGIALALAQRESPCLILMDITLPGMNGIEATRQILLGASSVETTSTVPWSIPIPKDPDTWPIGCRTTSP